MSLSKKDYVAIAKVLNSNADPRCSVADLDLRERHQITIANIAADLAQVFEADNPRFDVERFINAALTGEGI